MEYPSGLSFPFRISPAGGFAVVQGSAKVSANLMALVRSSIKERLIRKGVGTVSYDAVLRTASSSGLIPQLIREAFQKYEPRATNLSIKIYREDIKGIQHVFARVGYLFKLSGEPETVISVQLTD